jgi:hypothetical protein
MNTINARKTTHSRLAIALCAIVLAWAGVANASSVTYRLDGVTLSDGSELTGSFTVDWDSTIPTVTALSMTHTAGITPSTGAYINYDPYWRLLPGHENDVYPWAPLSGETSASSFSLATGVGATLAQYTADELVADPLHIIPNDAVPDNIWTLSIDNIVTSGVNEWQILFLDFNPETGELFFDGWYADSFGTEWYLQGSRLHQYVTFPADTTWATINGGSLTAVPVPATVWLFGSGLLGLLGYRSRKTV